MQNPTEVFFKKSREIVKKISNSFIYDPGESDPSINVVWDKKISNEIKSILLNNPALSGFKFYSEEEPASCLTPPLLMIDPIDGSREFLLDIPECVISMSFIHSWDLGEFKRGAHWIWNFRNGFEVGLIDGKGHSKLPSGENLFSAAPLLNGLVSRREWEEGRFEGFLLPKTVSLRPLGSIAYKLALLSEGVCDFVYSRSNKNIWDITAGTFILRSKGIKLYNSDGAIPRLDSALIQGPLLWCKEKDYQLLSSLLEV